MIRNTQEILKALKNKHNSWKALKWCAYRKQGFAEGILQVVLFTILCFKWSVKEYCVAKVFTSYLRYISMKIIVTLIPKSLVAN